MNKEKISSIISFLSLTSLVFFLILFSFQLYLYFPQFYDFQYEKNGVYDRLGYEKTWTVTYELWEYMQGDAEFYSGFYSERDMRHMIDVRNIIAFLNNVYFISGLLFLLSLFYFYTFHKPSFVALMHTVFLYTSYLCFGFVVVFLLCSLFFSHFFFFFHQLVFTNDYWLLDPAFDNLVVLFPESFFLWYFLFVIGTVLLFGIILFMLARYIKRRYLQREVDVA